MPFSSYTFQLIIFRKNHEIFIDISVSAETYESAIANVKDNSKELIEEDDKITFVLKSVAYR